MRCWGEFCTPSVLRHIEQGSSRVGSSGPAPSISRRSEKRHSAAQILLSDRGLVPCKPDQQSMHQRISEMSSLQHSARSLNRTWVEPAGRCLAAVASGWRTAIAALALSVISATAIAQEALREVDLPSLPPDKRMNYTGDYRFQPPIPPSPARSPIQVLTEKAAVKIIAPGAGLDATGDVVDTEAWIVDSPPAPDRHVKLPQPSKSVKLPAPNSQRAASVATAPSGAIEFPAPKLAPEAAPLEPAVADLTKAEPTAALTAQPSALGAGAITDDASKATAPGPEVEDEAQTPFQTVRLPSPYQRPAEEKAQDEGGNGQKASRTRGRQRRSVRLRNDPRPNSRPPQPIQPFQNPLLQPRPEWAQEAFRSPF